jgi:adenylate cyclase
MAEDEEAAVLNVKRLRELVEDFVVAHGGRVVDFTGDNFLAEFSSAIDAVSCGLEIQRTIESSNEADPTVNKMCFRMGIHLGDVRVEEERIYGNAVNIAARLEAISEAGGICISSAVHEQIRSRLPLRSKDLGKQRLKNIPQVIHAHRLRVEEGARKEGRTSLVSRPLFCRVVFAAATFLLIFGVLFVANLETASFRPGSLLALPLDFVHGNDYRSAHVVREADVRAAGRSRR